MTTRDTVLAYLRAVEATDPAAVEPFLHPEVQLTEHPNRITPAGATYDRAGVLAAAARGAALLSRQEYRVRALFVDGDRAAVQSEWIGTLARAAGPLPAGHQLRAHICSVFELRDGKVYRQEQYDCFVP